MRRINLHATAVVLGRHGLIVSGPSGAGKTSLALALVERCAARGVFAALVADDQVWLSAVNGRLVAEAPEAIAGLAEIRGFGPAPLRHEGRAVIDRAVRLVEPEAAPRLREEAADDILGVALPRLDLAARDSAAAGRAIAAWLELP